MLVALVAYAVAGVYATGVALWRPPGSLGLVSDYGATVRRVIPDGPAARAGIAVGDTIALARMPFADRRYAAGAGVPPPIGTAVRVSFVHDGVARDVLLTSVAAPLTTAERSSRLLEIAASLVFIIVGAGLVIVRPTRATWGFGLYCLLQLPTSAAPVRTASAAAAPVTLAVYDIVENVGIIGLVMFALDFPTPARTRSSAGSFPRSSWCSRR